MVMKKMGILALVSILIIMGIAVTNVSAVDYTKNITDPTGDVTGQNVVGEIKNDADITALKSSIKDGIITLQLIVAGVIHTTSTDYSKTYDYEFYIDVTNDGEEDWTVSVMYMYLFMASMSDDEGDHVYTLTGDNVTGNGTNTLTVKFPEEYITDEITGWDIYAETSLIDNTGSSYLDWKSAEDTAPDDGFSVDPEGDNDEDGMPNGWESANNLNANDPSDADEDADGDGYSNLEEYQAETDPQDKQSHPPELNTNIKVTITKPEEGEFIPGGGIGDYYTIEGTSAPPAGQKIDYVEYRIKEALDNDWQWCDDSSVANDWSTWNAQVSTYITYGIGSEMHNGENTLEVRAITSNDDYNIAQVTFYFNKKDGGSEGEAEAESESEAEAEAESESESESEGEVEDPSKETPTDTSIEIKITTTKYEMTQDGNIIKMDILIKGTTNGVDHCKIAFVEYYTDGTHDEIDWQETFDYPPSSYKENKSEINHFKATSANWKTWEYHVKGQMWVEKDDNDNDTDDGKPVKERKVYVRAFKDAIEKNWNQASETQKIEADGDGDDDGDGGGFLPGFELIVLMFALFVTIVLFSRHKK